MEILQWLQMLNTLDWLLVILLGAGAFVGLRRGFILMFAGLGGVVVAIGAALLFTGHVVQLMDDMWGILDRTREMLIERVPLVASIAEAELTAVPIQDLMDQLRAMRLPESYVDALGNAMRQAVPAAVSEGMVTFGEFLYYGMAAMLVSIVTFVALFVLARMVIRLAASGLHRTIRATPFSLINRLAGMAVGTIHYALLVTLGLGLLSPFLAMEAFGSLALLVDESAVAPYFIDFFYQFAPMVTDVEGWLLGLAGGTLG